MHFGKYEFERMVKLQTKLLRVGVMKFLKVLLLKNNFSIAKTIFSESILTAYIFFWKFFYFPSFHYKITTLLC